MAQEHTLPDESQYLVDVENVAEMARLIKQAKMVTQYVGLVPSSVDWSNATDILDIACGPGEWAISIAQAYPQAHVTGVDISHIMVSYAQAWARSQGPLPNTEFVVMNARRPLTFPDNSFDVIHFRFIGGFMSTTAWPELFADCYRMLRPGGTICSVEAENLGLSTSPAMTRFNSLVMEGFRKNNQSFTPAGDSIGITVVMERLMRDVGFTDVAHAAHPMSFSFGEPAHPVVLEDVTTFTTLIQPFLLRFCDTTQEELEELAIDIPIEMQSTSFQGMGCYQTVTGIKA